MLRITLRINDEQIGDYEVRNTGMCVCGCERNAYTVREIIEGREVGPVLTTVTHDRDDGAIVLAGEAMTALDKNWVDHQ